MQTCPPARAELAQDLRAPAAARRQVTSACTGLPADLVDTAVLLTSELVTNAIKHGDGRVLLTTHRRPDGLLVEVRDDGAGTPQSRASDPDAEHGRGLLLLDALATSWGLSEDEAEAGTMVWFALNARAGR